MSRNMPTINSKILTSNRIMSGLSLMAKNTVVACWGTCSEASDHPKILEVATIIEIDAVVMLALKNIFGKSESLIFFDKKPIIIATRQAIAPDWVAVKKPENIPPRIITGTSKAGAASRKDLKNCLNVGHMRGTGYFKIE